MPNRLIVSELREGLRAIRDILDRLEALLGSSEEQPDPYERRKAVLEEIYWAGNSMPRDGCSRTLRERGTQYQWVGQQVKKGYLSVLPLPGGSVRYSVTPRRCGSWAWGRRGRSVWRRRPLWQSCRRPPSRRSGTARRTLSMTSYERGDVVLVPFPFSERLVTKKRPAVVVSSNAYHRASATSSSPRSPASWRSRQGRATIASWLGRRPGW